MDASAVALRFLETTYPLGLAYVKYPGIPSLHRLSQAMNHHDPAQSLMPKQPRTWAVRTSLSSSTTEVDLAQLGAQVAVIFGYVPYVKSGQNDSEMNSQ
ncbi:hypothetical protein HJFPF1_02266 [Paramyrothecium foliicola]|nr:hypothetical protein HJFPF1_02266 [Paramyrothecium foliicola]